MCLSNDLLNGAWVNGWPQSHSKPALSKIALPILYYRKYLSILETWVGLRDYPQVQKVLAIQLCCTFLG